MEGVFMEVDLPAVDARASGFERKVEDVDGWFLTKVGHIEMNRRKAEDF